jgi:hypothetical protein
MNHSFPNAGKITSQRVLVLDHWLWYSAKPDFEPYIRNTLTGLYPLILGQSEIEAMLEDLLQRVLVPQSCVLLPLLAAALCYDVLVKYRHKYQCLIIPLPLSRHPYVTFAFDPPELLKPTLEFYCSVVESLWKTLPSLLSRWVTTGGQRIIFLDVNQSTGRDALLMEKLLKHWLGVPIQFQSVVLINETTEQVHDAPGWRGGPKARIPEHYAMRLLNHNTKYFSHLGYLQFDQDEQYARGDAARREFPHLLSFWDNLPDELRSIHGYQHSAEATHQRRLHLRYSKSEHEAGIANTVQSLWDTQTIHDLLQIDAVDAQWRLRQMQRVLTVFPS